MKALIKKDLYNLLSYKQSLIIIIAIIIITTITNPKDIYTLPMILIIMIGIISLSTFSYDEISKSDKYILALPVKKEDIVKSKYLLSIFSSLISAITGILLTFILYFILKEFKTGSLNLNINLLFINSAIGLLAFSLIQSVQIPCVYKWGAERGRIGLFIAIMIISLLVMGIYNFTTKVITIDLDLNLKYLLNNIYIIYIIIILICLVTELISYKLSLKIFKNKDY